MPRHPLSTQTIDYILQRIGDSGYVHSAELKSPPLNRYFGHLNWAARSIKLDYLYDQLIKGQLIKLHHVEELGGAQIFMLTPKGEQRLLVSRLRTTEISRPALWDGRWRLVAFRIPHQETAARQLVRLELKRLGLFCVQPGLWVHPFPFEDVVGQLGKAYGTTERMTYMEVIHTDHASPWRAQFASLLGDYEQPVVEPQEVQT